LVGKQDFDHMVERKSPDIASWMQDKANLELLSGDKDVFGDGSVIMLGTPGHTLGHHSLLVRLPQSGAIILTGDLWHFADQVNRNEMPVETADRAANLASRERITRMAANRSSRIRR
jgi:glyoxylase-like metal-dependent hydrolase (beta-lactamase superfamily II)